jgi:hypothetical protein
VPDITYRRRQQFMGLDFPLKPENNHQPMLAQTTWQKIPKATRVALWASYFTIAWAAAVWLIPRLITLVPNPIAYLLFASGVATFLGGCLALAYLAVSARSRPAFLWGAIASVLNFGYLLSFMHSIKAHTNAAWF